MDDGTISAWQRYVHATANAKGWWEPYKISNGDIYLTVDQTLSKLALITSEVSEAVECVRNGEPSLEFRDGKPEGIGAELADVVIRVMDLCEALDINLENCIDEKTQYNDSRLHRHGGKLA